MSDKTFGGYARFVMSDKVFGHEVVFSWTQTVPPRVSYNFILLDDQMQLHADERPRVVFPVKNNSPGAVIQHQRIDAGGAKQFSFFEGRQIWEFLSTHGWQLTDIQVPTPHTT